MQVHFISFGTSHASLPRSYDIRIAPSDPILLASLLHITSSNPIRLLAHLLSNITLLARYVRCLVVDAHRTGIRICRDLGIGWDALIGMAGCVRGASALLCGESVVSSVAL